MQHLDLRSTDELDSLIEDRIIALNPRLQIDEANVCLAHSQGGFPPFSVRVHLVTPGRDLTVEGCDYSLDAAIGKAMAQLESHIESRPGDQAQRPRNHPGSTPRIPIRWRTS